ncbi:MAG TPA: tetratricopeptide repeat protein [Chthonomonadaceae bacterium]|nr:tetratricopeptide repeat protein [Chthonomonadaceae bacterium]
MMNRSLCLNRASVLLRAVGTICLLAAAALLPVTALAQASRATVPSSGKAGLATSPSSQEVAGEILADALGNLWLETDAHMHEGEYNHIINLSRIIVQGDPQNLQAYENSAWLLWSTLRNDEAIAFLKQGIQANPNTYYLYDELAFHYLDHLKDPASALPYYEQAVRFPCPFFTWNNLARCYEKTNQWEKAVQTWERAAQIKNNPVASLHLKRAQAELARRQGTGVGN